jgi:hypothetical protein
MNRSTLSILASSALLVCAAGCMAAPSGGESTQSAGIATSSEGADAPAVPLPLMTGIGADPTATGASAWDMYIVANTDHEGFVALGFDADNNVVYEAEYLFDSQQWSLLVPTDADGNAQWPDSVDPTQVLTAISTQLGELSSGLAPQAGDPSASCVQALGARAASAVSTQLANASGANADVPRLWDLVSLGAAASDAIADDVSASTGVQSSDLDDCLATQAPSGS